jgi:hypothetical protein
MPLRVLRREFKRRLVGRCYQLEELAKKYHNAYILALIIDCDLVFIVLLASRAEAVFAHVRSSTLYRTLI